MIISKNINIKTQLPVKSGYIEEQLSLMGINPVRWAIIEINSDETIVSVSYEE